jgi:hypothetical protein
MTKTLPQQSRERNTNNGLGLSDFCLFCKPSAELSKVIEREVRRSEVSDHRTVLSGKIDYGGDF